MTQPTIRLKVRRKSIVKGKALIKFPALVTATSPILLDKTGGNFVFSLDIDALSEMLSTIFQPYEGVDQHITSAGPVTVWDNAGFVRVDQTVGAAMTLNMPLAASKTCPVLLSDWKGDAGTNNITVNAAGSETFPGGVASFKIDGDTASRFLRPVPGVGYIW